MIPRTNKFSRNVCVKIRHFLVRHGILPSRALPNTQAIPRKKLERDLIIAARTSQCGRRST